MSAGAPGAAERPLEPDHPMLLDGGAAPGDPEFMLRCLCEEFLRSGTAPDELRAMTRDPRYGAFAYTRRVLGDARAEAVVEETLSRFSAFFVRVDQKTRLPRCLKDDRGGPDRGA